MMDGVDRLVLAAGISLERADLDNPPEPGMLDSLTQAPDHAAAVAAAFGRFGYVPVAADEGLDVALKAAADGAARVLVVHVAGHGKVDEGTGELFVLGPDGEPAGAPVDEWVRTIERRRPGTEAPMALFVLDVCHAGAPLEAGWARLLRADRQRAWVLAAAGARDRAYDFRLSRAVTRVLDQYADGTLRVDPSVEYIPIGTVGTEIAREVARLSLGSPGSQTLDSTRVRFTELGLLDRLPFLPNPRWRGADGHMTGVDEAVRPFLDEALDEEHFASRASGAQANGVHSTLGYFRGRTVQMRELSQWLDSAERGCRVVTGRPGVGKSALLGVLVCAAHPVLRTRYAGLWRHLPRTPSANPRLTAVHARQRSAREIVDSIARQLGLAMDEPLRVEQRVENVVRSQEGSGQPVTIVIDALDEAQRPREVIEEVLVPLLDAGRRRGAAVRLLVGTRSEPGFSDLFDRVRGPRGRLVDLGQASAGEVRASLHAYISGLLADDTWYGSVDGAAAASAFASAAAARLTEAPLEWGEFLAAGLVTRHRLDSPPISDPAEAARYGRQAPRDLDRLLELDLGRPGQPTSLGPVLSALAFALGAGMPERIIAYVADAFTPGSNGPMPVEEVRAALEAGRFYLRRDVGRDGTTLYRLFHERLAEALRARPLGPGGVTLPADPGRPASVTVWRALMSAVPMTVAIREWRLADPYLLDQLPHHAAQAGMLDELLEDAGFLVHATPEELRQELPAAHSQHGRLVAAAYRASFPQHCTLPPAARSQLLAIDAVRFEDRPLARKLTAGEQWAVRWVAPSADTRLLHTLIGHKDAVRTVATTTLGDHPIAITTSHDNTARVWDLASGVCLHTLTGHTDAVNVVATTTLGDHPIAITTSYDNTARVWDLTDGSCLHILTGHTDLASRVATAVLGGRPIAITASYDKTARVWDLTSGACLHNLTGHKDDLHAVAIAMLGDHPIAITAGGKYTGDRGIGDQDDTARVWDLDSGACLHTLVGHTDAVYAAATTTLGDRPIAITAGRDATVRVWDLTDGFCLQTLTGHGHAVIAVSTAILDGRPIAITASYDKTARVWDLTSGACLHTLTGHANGIFALASMNIGDHPVAITASSDQTARAWDLTNGACLYTLAGHTGALHAVTTAILDGRAVAVTVGGEDPADGDDKADRHDTAQVWELSSGAHPYPPTGHTESIVTGATAVSDGHPLVVTAGRDATVRVWDLTDGFCLQTLTGHGHAVIAVSTAIVDSRPIAITASYDNTARVWHLTDGACLHTLTGHSHGLTAVATAILGRRPIAITTSWDSTARVWDLTDGSCLHTLTGHDYTVESVATAILDGRPIAITTSNDNTARVWDLASGACLHTLTGHTDSVDAVTTAIIDGRPIAVTTSRDSTARVWDLTDGSCLHILTGHSYGLTAVTTAVLDSGPIAVTTSWDNTARVWDLASGACLHTLTGHTDSVDAVTTAIIDGRPIAVTTSRDSTARVWDLTDGIERVTQHFPQKAGMILLDPATGVLVAGFASNVTVLEPSTKE